MDEFDEFECRSRPFNLRNNRPFLASHDDCSNLPDQQRLQAKMRMRASFKSEHAYRQKKKSPEGGIDQKSNPPLVNKDAQRNSTITDFDSSEEIDCDFPSGDEKGSSEELETLSSPSSKYNSRQRCPSPMRTRVGSPSVSLYNSRTPLNSSPQTHHRSKSCRFKSRQMPEKQFQPREGVHQRTLSMPSRSRRPKLNVQVQEDNDDEEEDTFYLIRTFSTSNKGIINRGDSFKKKPLSAQSSIDGSRSVSLKPSPTSRANSFGSCNSVNKVIESYSVYLIGNSGVGKTALIRQFMSSDYMGNAENAVDRGSLQSVSVLLDNAESTLDFIDLTDVDDLKSDWVADAFVVVFAVNDRDSFDDAIMCLHELRKRALLDRTATILVANKGDIVRGRDVEEEEAKKMAVRYKCKYMEVSAIINVKVDELLAGVLKQIRLKDEVRDMPRKSRKPTCLSDDSGCIPQPGSIVKRIFGKNPREFRSCDNLLVL